MRGKHRAEPEEDYTDIELEAFGEFSEAARDGNPNIEEYLRRVPESAHKLRAILETVMRLSAEVGRFRVEYPDIDLGRLLDPGRCMKSR